LSLTKAHVDSFTTIKLSKLEELNSVFPSSESAIKCLQSKEVLLRGGGLCQICGVDRLHRVEKKSFSGVEKEDAESNLVFASGKH
jgi:hypothetical protein